MDQGSYFLLQRLPDFRYYCTACSDLSSKSGEMCILNCNESFPPDSINRKVTCLKNYPVPPDWHWVCSPQVTQQYIHLFENELWDIHIADTGPYSEEQKLWDHAKNEIDFIRRLKIQSKKHFAQSFTLFDGFEYHFSAKPVKNEEDSIHISSGWKL